MRKIKLILFALLAGLALTSCTEFYVKKYEAACKDGDASKAAVYAAKLVGKELSPEQESRVENAAVELLNSEASSFGFDSEDAAEGWE